MSTAVRRAQRFLVICPQGLGDSLEATPMVRALRTARPDSRIDVIVLRSGPKALYEGLDGLVNEVVYLPYWEQGRTAFVREVLRRRFRPAYDFSFLSYPAAKAEYNALSAAFPSRRRVAHRYWDESGRKLSSLQTDLVDVEHKHNVLRNMDLLSVAGIEFDAPQGYAVPDSWIAPATERRSGTIAMHVGSVTHDGLDSKRWPLQYFAAVARHFVAAGARVEAVMGPDERTETLALIEDVPGVSAIEGSLAEVARYLSTVDVVLCNDSGIGHLAAGVGTSVVALFGPTPVEFAPFGSRTHVLRPSPCPPCFDPRLLNTDCALDIDYRCLRTDLTPRLVIETIENVRAATTLGATRAVS